MIEQDGLQFRDLDHDGVLAPYEDHRVSTSERVDDLMSRLTLDEKVGLMLHGTANSDGPLSQLGVGSEYDLDAANSLILDRNVTSMITRLAPPPRQLAEQNNALQAVAARGRLGIPLTISTDPRNQARSMFGASVDNQGASMWPDWLGLGAINDPELVRRFGEVVRREYRATGIHMALSPQADLATEPRWARTSGTFGSDPVAVRSLVGAFVAGLQGGVDGLQPDGVSAIVKHWVGYGASRDGFDGHNYYGRFSAFPADRFDDHVTAFLDAFEHQVAGVMPTYNILDGFELDGTMIEQVAAGFSSELLTDLLRGRHRFDGLVVSDWGITTDVTEGTKHGPQRPTDISMAWGVDHLSRPERYAKGINAGIDQFGGEEDPAPLLAAHAEGRISEERIDESARRVLEQKFTLGLFDQPFVDADEAVAIVGDANHHADADAAQRRSITMLKGDASGAIGRHDVVWTHGLEPATVEAAGFRTTDDVTDATVAVIHVDAPYETLHPEFFFGRMQHEGDLDFKADDPIFEVLRSIPDATRTVVVTFLDRPAILTDLEPFADVLVADFAVSDAAIVDVLAGTATAEGRLPFELPRTMASVLAHPADRPGGLDDPLFPIGHRVD